MNSTAATIVELKSKDALRSSVAVIVDSFRTVAEEFGLTTENCPTHPSFITFPQLRALEAKGLKLFGLFLSAVQVGFVAIERASADLYMEKLAVLPECRHRGYGARLAAFVRRRDGRPEAVAYQGQMARWSA